MKDRLPMDFDWVSARHKCSTDKLFEQLYLEAKKNVETMNALRPSRPWQFTDGGGGFSVGRRHDFYGYFGVRFSIRGALITADGSGEKVQVGMSAAVTLGDDGECRLLLEGQELDRWQFLRRALEPLLFMPEPD